MHWAWPAVALLFLGLYVWYLSAGADAESALIQAGGAGVLVALLLRVAVRVVDSADHANRGAGHHAGPRREAARDGTLPGSEMESTAGSR
jgi:hypothetical protein